MKPGARRVLTESLSDSAKYLIPILSIRWVWLLGCTIGAILLDTYFEQMVSMDPKNDMLRYVGSFGMALSSLCVSVVILFLVPLTIDDLQNTRSRPTSVWSFSHSFLWPLTLEGLRVLAQILIWALLLVIPGVYKSIRLHFVPFIVMFDPEYERGNVDALQRSHQLTGSIFFSLFFILLAGLIIELILDAPVSYTEGAIRHLARVLTTPLTVAFYVYSVGVTYFMFQKTHQRLTLESAYLQQQQQDRDIKGDSSKDSLSS